MLEYYCRIQKQGYDYNVSFPDFPDVYIYHCSLSIALKMAEESLEGYLESKRENIKDFKPPKPSDFSKVRGYYKINIEF